MIWVRPIAIVNATVLDGRGGVFDSVRINGRTVSGLGAPPGRRDFVIDAEGGVVAPGLVNAHEHLELNSFGRLKWRDRHQNVSEWIADFQPRFRDDIRLAPARADTLHDRLWVGGLKNLLSGATTVCHHNPLHAPLRRRFPVRVVRHVGHSHSLLIDGGVRVKDAYRATSPAWPWIIHAAEGVDECARGEIESLRELGCLGANTVLVHGVGMSGEQAREMTARSASLVWCPSSNDFLFGRTADVREFSGAGRLALGTDSRLSGAGDLLDELREARRTGQVQADGLVRAVTGDAGDVLRLAHAGRLSRGSPADLVVLRRVSSDPHESLVSASRGDVRLVMIDGRPLVGDVRMRAAFAERRQSAVDVRVDGRPRLLASWIARRAAAMRLPEPGLEVQA